MFKGITAFSVQCKLYDRLVIERSWVSNWKLWQTYYFNFLYLDISEFIREQLMNLFNFIKFLDQNISRSTILDTLNWNFLRTTPCFCFELPRCDLKDWTELRNLELMLRVMKSLLRGMTDTSYSESFIGHIVAAARSRLLNEFNAPDPRSG